MAEVLYRSMWLENWGSGAKRIMEACQEQGVEEPIWRWDGAFVYVTFKRPFKQELINEDIKQGSEKKPSKHDPSTTQARPKYDPNTTQVRQLIEIMDAEYLTLKDIMSLLNLNSAKRFRENYLNPAIVDGALKLIIFFICTGILDSTVPDY